MIKKLLLVSFFFTNVLLFAASPVLSNFRVEDSQKNRVYFDSSEPITGSNTTGFIIVGRTITSVTINAGQTTNHYFVVSSAFDFWDNNSIRYTGGSNIQNSSSEGLLDFDLQYIDNNISEPTANNFRYVSVSGGGDGTSPDYPWTMTQAMSNATAGMTVYIKAGNYGSKAHILSGDGTSTSPIKLIGYNDNDGIGVKPTYTWTHTGVRGGGKALDVSKMPLFNRAGINGIFLNFSGRNIIIKNLMINNSDTALNTNGSNIHIENVYSFNTINGGDNFYGTSDANTNIRIINSVAYNGGTELIRVYGNNLLFENNIIRDDANGVDYYLSSRGSNSIFRNNYLERLGTGHTGHGITIKSETSSSNGSICEYNLVEKNEIYGIDLSIEARKIGVKYNVFRDITIAKNATGDKVKSIIIMQGADYNIFDRINVNDATYGITFVNNDSETNGNVGNIIKNSNFSNVQTGVMFSPQKDGITDSNNVIINCNFYNVTGGGSELIETNGRLSSNNSFINNNVHTATELGDAFGFSFSHNNFYNNGTSIDALVGTNNNIDVNPQWTNPGNQNFTLSENSPISVTEGGIFNSNVKYDAFGNERKTPVSIGAYEDSDPVIGSVSSGSTSICNGESVTLVAAGGTSYSWNTGETTASITVNPSTTTTYTVTISDGTNSDSHDVIVTVNQAAAVDLGPDHSICFGETITLTATGTGDFLWNTGETTASISVSPIATTTYSVTASNSCTTNATDEIIVNVNPEIGLTVGSDISICVGDSTTLVATGNGDFLWNTGETTPSITVQPNTTTTYSVASSIGTCTENASILVTVSEAPSVDLGADQSICFGETVTLTANGTGDFLWNTGEATTSITVNPTITTTYSVIASNACSDTVSDDIIINVNPEIGLTVGNDISICVGESTTLTATGNGDFLWNTGETTPSITVQPNNTTAYTVTSSLGVCTENASVIVTISDSSSVDLGPDKSICNGETLTLTATGSGNFLWNTGETTSSITVNPITTTTYSVTASNSCSGDATDDITINVNDLPSVNAGDDITILDGESTTLTATGSGSFLWNTGETSSSITVNPTSTTAYSVVLTSGQGCSDQDTVVVTVDSPEGIIADAGPDQNTCPDSSDTVLTASGGDTYLWSTGETTASITVSPLETTVYTVAVYVGNSHTFDDVTVYIDESCSDNIVAKQEFKIYPNPSMGLVNIEMTGFNGNSNISLYNLNGSMVHTENMNNSSKKKVLKSQLNLSRLAKGMYIVRVNNGDQVVTKKLVVI